MKRNSNSRRGGIPKAPSRRRTIILKVYTSRSQAELIRRRARRAGCSVSSFLLAAGRAPGAIHLVPPINREAFASLSRIGGLLNQLDRHLNAGIQLPFGGPMPDLFELAGLLLLIRQQMLGLDTK